MLNCFPLSNVWMMPDDDKDVNYGRVEERLMQYHGTITPHITAAFPGPPVMVTPVAHGTDTWTLPDTGQIRPSEVK